MTTILIVDDEKSMRDFLKILLTKEGYEVIIAGDGNQALSALGKNSVDLVISDIRMPGMGGLELLAKVKDESDDIPVIMITAFASPNDAVQAMKSGAYDYISKPFNVDEIKSVIYTATNRTESTLKLQQAAELFPEIIGESNSLLYVLTRVKQVAETDAGGRLPELLSRARFDVIAVDDKELSALAATVSPQGIVLVCDEPQATLAGLALETEDDGALGEDLDLHVRGRGRVGDRLPLPTIEQRLAGKYSSTG